MITGTDAVSTYLFTVSPVCRFPRSVWWNAENLRDYRGYTDPASDRLRRIAKLFDRAGRTKRSGVQLKLCRIARQVADCPACGPDGKPVFVVRDGKEKVPA